MTSSCQESDPVGSVVGLHVLTDFAGGHIYITENPTPEIIVKTIRDLDWVNGFHQVIITSSPGVSMEVGGSLRSEDGLSSVYRDTNNRIYRVTKVPPSTVEQMEKILLSFHAGNNKWEKMYEYELLPY